MNKPAYIDSLSAGGEPLWNSGSQVVELRKRTFVHLVDLATYTHNQPFEAHCAPLSLGRSFRKPVRRGSLTETIDADWIDDLEALEERLREYTKPKERPDPFRARYANGLMDAGGQWDQAVRVLAREDITAMLSLGWTEQRAAPRR